MKKRKMVLIAIFCLMAVLIGMWGGYFAVVNFKSLAAAKEENQKSVASISDKSYTNMIFAENSNIVVVTDGMKEILIDIKGNVIDNNLENGKIDILYDDYYTITKDSVISLKRNNKEIIKSTAVTDAYTLFKDSDDSSAKYISMYYKTESNIDTARIASFTNSDGILVYYLYNSITGNILVRDAKIINPILIDNKITMFRIVKQDDTVYLLNINDITKEIALNVNYALVSDVIRSNNYSSFYSASSKHLIIKNQSDKYGLIGINGEILINPKYENLYFSGNADEYIIAVNNQKYGIINSKDETLLPFEYDGIEIHGEYIVLLKNNAIGIKKLDFKNIYDFEIPYTKEYYIRPSYGNSNSFAVTVSADVLILKTFENNNDNTYLLNFNGLIKTFNNQKTTLIYNYQNLISDFYIITEEKTGKTAKTVIYDLQGKEINSFENSVDKDINLISYSLLKGNTLKIIYYDDAFNVLDGAIVNIAYGKLIEKDITNKYREITKLNDGYFIKDNGVLKIYNSQNKEITVVEGEAIYYLKDNVYALFKNNDEWYLVEINN